MRVGAVLDTAAVLRFAAAKDVAIGELIGEVADSQSFIAIPVTALADARASVSSDEEQRMLGMLIGGNRNVVLISLDAADGMIVGGYAALIDRELALAHAVQVADSTGGQLVTTHGDQVREIFGEMSGIIDI
jgi:hypothetical protein